MSRGHDDPSAPTKGRRTEPAEFARQKRDQARDKAQQARDSFDRGQAKVVERARGRVASTGDTKVSDGNIANLITIIRILMAPAFVWLLLADAGSDGILRYIAAVLFIVAIATDGVDGHLARRRNLVTNVGIMLDPIADKILIGGALVSLTILGELPWWVTTLILLREVGITVMRFSLLKDRIIPASRGGKLKTVIQSVAISVALVPIASIFGAMGVANEWVDWFNTILMSAALILTVVTGAEYLYQAFRRNKA